MKSICKDTECVIMKDKDITQKNICCYECEYRESCNYACDFDKETCSYNLKIIEDKYNLELNKSDLLYLKLTLINRKNELKNNKEQVDIIENILNNINNILK